MSDSAAAEEYDFTKSLAKSTKWKNALSERLEKVLTTVSIENIALADHPADVSNEHPDIDTMLMHETADYDVKTQRHDHYTSGNLPFETVSVVEDNVPGWFYTSQADIVVWVYTNEDDTGLMERGYLVLHDEYLREWFNERIMDFPSFEARTPRGSQTWTTLGRLVPIEDIPKTHIVQFDPTALVEEKTDSGTMREFLSIY